MCRARDEAAGNRIVYVYEHDGNCPRLAGKGLDHGRVLTEDHVGSKVNQLFCEPFHSIRITTSPTKFDPKIDAFRPPQLREGSSEHHDLGLSKLIALRIGH